MIKDHQWGKEKRTEGKERGKRSQQWRGGEKSVGLGRCVGGLGAVGIIAALESIDPNNGRHE